MIDNWTQAIKQACKGSQWFKIPRVIIEVLYSGVNVLKNKGTQRIKWVQNHMEVLQSGRKSVDFKRMKKQFSLRRMTALTLSACMLSTMVPMVSFADTSEQFNLPVGKHYYFYNNGEWVEHIYAGTVNAYTLNSEEDTVNSVSPYAHSLFISLKKGDQDIEERLGEKVRYGENVTYGGITYEKRLMSGGFQPTGESSIEKAYEFIEVLPRYYKYYVSATPTSNEWQQLVDKGMLAYFPSENTWVQEKNIVRGKWSEENIKKYTTVDASYEKYTSSDLINVLEVPSSLQTRKDALKDITFDFQGGTFKEGIRKFSTVIKNGENYTVPKWEFYEPILGRFKEWNTKADGTGTSYHPDDSVPSSVDTLYAIYNGPAADSPRFNITYATATGNPSVATFDLDNLLEGGTYTLYDKDGNQVITDNPTMSVEGNKLKLTFDQKLDNKQEYQVSVKGGKGVIYTESPKTSIAVYKGKTAAPTFSSTEAILNSAEQESVSYTITNNNLNNTYKLSWPAEYGDKPIMSIENNMMVLTFNDSNKSAFKKLNDETTYRIGFQVTAENKVSVWDESDSSSLFLKPNRTSTPKFSSSTQKLEETSVKFTLSNTLDGDAVYKVYDTETGTSEAQGVSVDVSGSTLTLTFENPPKKSTAYYITARDITNNQFASSRAKVTVKTDGSAYAELGNDTTASVLFSDSDDDTVTKTDTIDVETHNPEAGTATFKVEDFSISSSSTEEIAIEGVSLTNLAYSYASLYNELTIQVAKSALNGGSLQAYLWYNHSLVGEVIIIRKTPTPQLKSSDLGFASENTNTIDYTLSNANPNAFYQVYASYLPDAEPVTDPAVSVNDTILTLTFTDKPTEKTTYYLRATVPGQEVSDGKAIYVRPYEAPSVTLGKDKELTLVFAYSDADTVIKTDTITATLNQGTNTSYTFQASDFTVSSSDREKNPIDGITVKSAQYGKISINVAKSVDAATAYLWYSDTNVGEITINKTVSDPSNVATLSGIYLSPGTLVPKFSSDTSNYTVTVKNSVSKIRVTPATTHNYATIKVNDEVYSSSNPPQINLNVGSDNIINIEVTAEDGTTKKEYQITVTREKPETSAPAFIKGGNIYTKKSVDDNEAVFTLSEEGVTETEYKVYDTSAAENTSENVSISASGATLKLTGISDLTEDTRYYITATAPDTPESSRTIVTVKPYVAPSVQLGTDTTVKVTFQSSDQNTATQTDTIGVTLDKGSSTTYAFQTSDFTISSSSSTKSAIDDVSIKAVGEDTLTVEIAKSVAATSGYLWYGDESIGKITFSKTVQQPTTYSVTIGSFTNGSVSANSTSVAAGTTVTLTINPDSGYELDAISVKKTGYTETVSLSGSGNKRTFTMPEYDVTVEATFKLNADQGAVNTAKSAVEEYTFTVKQADANTSAAVKSWLVTEINTLLKEGTTGITVSADNISMNDSFTAAQAGTSQSQNGTNGSFSFTATLTKNGTSVTTRSVSGTITATTYVPSVQSAAPEFSKDSYTKASANENTAEFILKTAAASSTAFTVYAKEQGGESLDGISAEAEETKLTLTGISGVTEETNYYISATEESKTESTRTKVTVKPYTASKSSAKQITGFTIPNQVGQSAINQTEHTITVIMPYGTNVASLTPVITISNKAAVSPESETAQDFTNPVTYTVTAEDETTQAYQVTVEVQSAPVTKYDVTYNLTNITANNQPEKVESGKKLEATLTAGSGYTLPESITVEMGGNALEDTDYTYNKSTGTVVIDTVTGAVKITAVGVSNTQASSDATLSALTYQIGQGAVTKVKGFSADTATYNVELPYGTSKTAEITLEGTVNNSEASITTNEGVTLSDGEGTAKITVTAQNGTTKTYTVNFTIASAPAAYVAVTNITGVPDKGTVGTGLTLEGTVAPANATNQEIIWSIKDAGETGASIADGVLTVEAAGKVTVTATVTNGKSESEDFTKDFDITFEDASDFVAVTDITGVLDKGTVGTGLTLEGTVAPADATNKEIIWSIKDAGETGASIADGVLTVEAAGTVTITATVTNGKSESEDFTKDFDITFEDASDFVAVTDIIGIPETATVGKKLKIAGTVKPANATYQEIIWEITDDGDTGAYFDSDKYLVAEAAGKITLTATIENGTAEGQNYTQEFTITVAATASSSDAEYVEKAANELQKKSYKISQSATEDEGNFLSELVKLINAILEKLFDNDVERIGNDDISNLEITEDPVAGDEEDHNGEDGTFSFDVEIHKGDESIIVEGLTGTITATPFVDDEQQEKDQEAVEEAIAAIEDAEYNIPQKSALTKDKLASALKAKLKKKVDHVTISGIQFVGDIEFAVAGTKDSPDGTDGTFTFKVSVSKGSVEDQWTDELEGTIVADEYVLKSPKITTTSLPDGTSGEEYNAQLKAESDTEVTWSKTAGDLPTGIELAEDGSLSGTPTEDGRFTFTVNADNGSEKGTTEKELSITINAPSDQETYTITASARTGGTISPTGEVTVASGGKQVFTITPANRYYTSDVLVDGNSVGRQSSYTFENVTGNHTIEAVFERGSIGPSGGGSSGGSSSSGGGSSSSTSSTGNKATTTSNTTTTESGGQVTTSQTTDPTTGQTVTTTIEKDPAGNVTGANASVPTVGTTASVGDGKAQINATVNGSLVSQAVGAAGATVPVNVTVGLPKQEVLAQLNNEAVSNVSVDLTIPSQVGAGGKAAVTGITLDPEVVVAAQASGKDLTVTVKDEKGNLAYEWQIDGAALQGNTQEATAMNLAVDVKPVQSLTGTDEDVKTAAGAQEGLYVEIYHNGTLPATVRVKVASQEGSGLQTGAEVSLYRYNPATKQLEAVDNNRYPVAADGTVTIPVGQGGEYVLLPAAVLPPAGSGNVHTVKKGEYPYLIAKQYGCSVEELMAANHIADANNLQVGQQLVIPGR